MCSCKVHFVTGDDLSIMLAAKAAGVNYVLFSAFDFVKKAKRSYRADIQAPRLGFKHVIVDSGLFTLMFGAKAGGSFSSRDMWEWMERIAGFANENDLENATFVECDCQKIVGCEETWRIRRRFEEMMPGKDVMNVFHVEDGERGFDELVEFAEYIGISVPEMRLFSPSGYRKIVAALARRAKSRKPSVKIHLLGCTEERMLRENRFVESADSTSWLSWRRYGGAKGRKGNHHVSALTEEAMAGALEAMQRTARLHGLEYVQSTEKRRNYDASTYYCAVDCLEKYRRSCGSQD